MQEKTPIAKLSPKELRLGYTPKKKATKIASKKTAKRKKI